MLYFHQKKLKEKPTIKHAASGQAFFANTYQETRSLHRMFMLIYFYCDLSIVYIYIYGYIYNMIYIP